VSYTGTGANATVGHGLGVVPKMIIKKELNNADKLDCISCRCRKWWWQLQLNTTIATDTDSTILELNNTNFFCI
jgi:hypothetical protein